MTHHTKMRSGKEACVPIVELPHNNLHAVGIDNYTKPVLSNSTVLNIEAPVESPYSGASFSVSFDWTNMTARWISPIYHPIFLQHKQICSCALPQLPPLEDKLILAPHPQQVLSSPSSALSTTESHPSPSSSISSSDDDRFIYNPLNVLNEYTASQKAQSFESCSGNCSIAHQSTEPTWQHQYLADVEHQIKALLSHPELFRPCSKCIVNKIAYSEVQSEPAFFARKARARTPGADFLSDDDLRACSTKKCDQMDFSFLLRTGLYSDIHLVCLLL